ncbi:hypothetical protein NN561_007791 [Cricetulus griseus]
MHQAVALLGSPWIPAGRGGRVSALPEGAAGQPGYKGRPCSETATTNRTWPGATLGGSPPPAPHFPRPRRLLPVPSFLGADTRGGRRARGAACRWPRRVQRSGLSERESGRTSGRASGRASERASGRAGETEGEREGERESGRASGRAGEREDERESEREGEREGERESRRDGGRAREREDERESGIAGDLAGERGSGENERAGRRAGELTGEQERGRAGGRAGRLTGERAGEREGEPGSGRASGSAEGHTLRDLGGLRARRAAPAQRCPPHRRSACAHLSPLLKTSLGQGTSPQSQPLRIFFSEVCQGLW